MYEDKLDGKIDEEFWTRKMADWHTRKRALQGAADALNEPVSDQHVLSAQRTLELANKAHFLYLTRSPAEQGQLLQIALLNCATGGINYHTHIQKALRLDLSKSKK